MTKLKEIVENILYENGIILTEFAHKKYDAERFVVGLGKPIILHVFKILAYGKIEPTRHWYEEITSWLRSISDIRLKPNNKLLKIDEIEKWILEPFYVNSEFSKNHYLGFFKRLDTDKYPIDNKIKNVIENNSEKVINIIRSLCETVMNPNDLDENKIEEIFNTWFNEYNKLYF